MVLEIFCIILLCSGTAYAIWDDRHGDKHPNNDLFFISIVSVISAIFAALINPHHGFAPDLLRGLVLSAAIYITVFPYAINATMYYSNVITNKKWWNHLSPTAVPDRWWIWKSLHWSIRMLILAATLTAAGIFYAR